jgi:hypothetical protein
MGLSWLREMKRSGGLHPSVVARINCACCADVSRPLLLPKRHVVGSTTRRAVPAQLRPNEDGYKLFHIRATVTLLSSPPAIRMSTREKEKRGKSEDIAYLELTITAAAACRFRGHVILDELHCDIQILGL